MTTETMQRSPLTTPTLVVGVVAAVLGVLSVAPGFGVLAAGLAFIAALAAIVIGHIATARTTDRRARVGLTLGYIGLAVTIIMLIIRFAAAA